ncbi:MAG: TIGR02147 family protein [Pseudobacteriovorax sp.]|nr:TIGR02147 family protein [Pseudobacteriovorax sp.]
MDIYRFSDYRDILREELLRRSQQNPSYSQGAFARDICLTPSRLSEILNGKQGISVKVALDIAKSLRFDDEQAAFFGDLVESQHGRSRLSRESAGLRLDKYRDHRSFNLAPELLEKLLSKWYFLAALEAVKGKLITSLNPIALSQLLKISPEQAESAVNVLRDLGLVYQVDGVWLTQAGHSGIKGSMSHKTLASLHTQMVELSFKPKQDPSQTKVSSYMVGIDSSRLPEFINYLNESVEYFVSRVSDSESKNSMYGLSVSFFPVTDDSLAFS